MGHVRHLYVHLPFCAHRCGYCDFVTVVGRTEGHDAYVDALVAELELRGDALEAKLETVFIGGGTPTFTEPGPLGRLLAALPAADEVTVEANPETVTPALAELLHDAGVTRVSLGAQTFQSHLLDVLERQAQPEDVRGAVGALREVGFDNVSLDLIYGIPGQTVVDLESDLAAALALGPEHLSCYELEAKRGTPFTHAYGAALERQADVMESYFERVVETLTVAGYRWYETANFCLEGERDLRARHNLGYWLGHDYLGIGIGAVSTVAGERRRNLPGLPRYVAALSRGEAPACELESIDEETRACEALMLGLRLDEPLVLADVAAAVDERALARLAGLGLVELSANGRGPELRLTQRGRYLGGAVTAELMA